jgi:hypothetical protein
MLSTEAMSKNRKQHKLYIQCKIKHTSINLSTSSLPFSALPATNIRRDCRSCSCSYLYWFYFLPVISHSIFYTFSQTLSNVLELRVTETEGQRLQRNQYKYEQLHDLQSRLMLVAGKAEKGK